MTQNHAAIGALFDSNICAANLAHSKIGRFVGH
jgi:hypothetical protein